MRDVSTRRQAAFTGAVSDSCGPIRLAGRAVTQGMTLIEIMVVIAIIGLLTTVVAIKVVPMFFQAERQVTELDLKRVQSSAAGYWIRTRQCPTIDDLVDDDSVNSGQAKDEWGTPLQVSCTGESIEVRSAGRDKALGTEDDLFFDGEDHPSR